MNVFMWVVIYIYIYVPFIDFIVKLENVKNILYIYLFALHQDVNCIKKIC